MEYGYFYCLIILNLGKMNFIYQSIKYINVGNFRILLMVNGFPTGEGGDRVEFRFFQGG